MNMSSTSTKGSNSSTSQQSEAERIRKRFLHKIGIESAHPHPQATNAPQQRSQPLTCLGDVVPLREPLKVCLDDSSSTDDEDDDFYFGDSEEEYEDMDYYHALYVGPKRTTSSMKSSGSAELTASTTQTSGMEHGKISGTSSLSRVVSDEGSRSASQTSLESFSTSASSAYSSTGTLNQDSGEMQSCRRDGKETSRPGKKKRRVCLDQEVSVIPIPMRHEYSDRAKERLWSTATELFQNAARNSIEFAAEGWDWRTVTEDEQMILCQESGELIHPIHIHNFLLERGLIPPTSVPLCPGMGSRNDAAQSIPAAKCESTAGADV